MMSIEQITGKIAEAYTKEMTKTGRTWIKISTVAQVAGLTEQEITAGILDLRDAEGFETSPWQLAPYLLTEADRQYAVEIAREAHHMMSWA